MVWGTEDSIGLISTIFGKFWFFIMAWTPIYRVFISPASSLFIGGIIIQSLGIYAVVSDSKLGIGGFAFGTLYILLGFIYLMPPRIQML